MRFTVSPVSRGTAPLTTDENPRFTPGDDLIQAFEQADEMHHDDLVEQKMNRLMSPR